jgi:hypothetical protein
MVRERDKTTKQQARSDEQLLAGKHKMKQITAVIDTRLANPKPLILNPKP